jgi:hypothetical protein
MSDTFLTKEEVAELTGLKTKRRQVEQLRKMGLPFWLNAAEAPIVLRSAIEGKATMRPPAPKPQWVPPGLRAAKN